MASSGRLPRFFSVFLSHYSSNSLLIPTSYYEHLPRRLPKTSILMGNSGKFWKVGMLSKQGQVYFDKGWANFVADNELRDGEFLTFVFDGYNRYEVSIYGLGGCKEMRALIDVEEISDGTVNEGDTGDSSIQVEEISDGTAEYSYNTDGEIYDSANQVEEIMDDTESDSEYSPGSLDATAISVEDAEVVNTTQVVNTTATSRNQGTRKIQNGEAYLDDPNNIHFVTSLKARTYELLIYGKFVKDYQLRFGNEVKYIDRFGILTAKTSNWADKRICIKKWNIICDRNNITRDDSIVCEILRTANNVVHTIKIHLVRDGVLRA